MANLKNYIDLLFNHFENIRNSINKIKISDIDEVTKSILFCSLLDTLSKTIYPKIGNRERFTSFLEDFSGWENKNRISLVQLYYFLKDENDKVYEPIKSYVAKKVSSMIKGNVYETNFDEYLYELKYLKVIESQIQQFSYANLFYKFRNHLVHEFRTPGFGSIFFKTPTIHYHALTQIDGNGPAITTWELVFPSVYLSNILEKSIKNLKEYCLLNKYNPYDSFEFKTLWLNKSEIKNKKYT